jgi:hypothetical protein
MCISYHLNLNNNIHILNKLSQILLIKRIKLPYTCIIDPYEISSIFIQNFEKDNGIIVDGLIDTFFNDYELDGGMSTLERIIHCVEKGVPLLLKDPIDKSFIKLIEPILELRKK